MASTENFPSWKTRGGNTATRFIKTLATETYEKEDNVVTVQASQGASIRFTRHHSYSHPIEQKSTSLTIAVTGVDGQNADTTFTTFRRSKKGPPGYVETTLRSGDEPADVKRLLCAFVERFELSSSASASAAQSAADGDDVFAKVLKSVFVDESEDEAASWMQFFTARADKEEFDSMFEKKPKD